MTTLLVGALIVAGVALTTAVQRDDSPKAPKSPEPSRTHSRIDLAERITAFAADTVAEAGYSPPRRVERRTVAEGVGLLVEGRRKEADRKLAEVDFGVRTLTDSATGRRFAEVADLAEEDTRGWGRVYVALDGPVRWSVQVPHPVADADSEQLGAGVLTAAPGGVMVMAGA
ncbi:MAG TPA: hypothetical protein VFH94_14690, partial [Streptomyces sp.]|nr:hypothetical protein [Streptomyces sp.]